MLSPSMTEGTLANWLKKEGDPIKSGEVIAEVETDKAMMDLEAFDSGFLRKILTTPGTKVPINTPIAILTTTADEAFEIPSATPVSSPPPPAAPAPAQPSSNQPTAPSSLPPVQAAPTPSFSNNQRQKISPLAKKVAQAQNIPTQGITGTGPGGRIVKRDVLQAAQNLASTASALFPSGPIARDERIPLTSMRQTIARRLLESKTQIPHFYLQIEINADALVHTRTALNDALATLPNPVKLSYNDFVMKAVVQSLRAVPAVNSSFEGDAIRQHSEVHLAFAVALENGLITPVIRSASSKNIRQISIDTKNLAAKAREGKLKPEEYLGGTFTVSNLGMMGIDAFSAIINPPQAAILAVGNIVKKPVVNEHDHIVVGHRMCLTLSCDHRVVDGSIGAHFLAEMRRFLENPALLIA
jgi:pyruvate dehydrogenase E2 component (dihydrolipoamide acetyltransferase)